MGEGERRSPPKPQAADRDHHQVTFSTSPLEPGPQAWIEVQRQQGLALTWGQGPLVPAELPLPGLELSGLLAQAGHAPAGLWHPPRLAGPCHRLPCDQKHFAQAVGDKKGREIGGLLQGFEQGRQLVDGRSDVPGGGQAGHPIELGLRQGRVEGQAHGRGYLVCGGLQELAIGADEHPFGVVGEDQGAKEAATKDQRQDQQHQGDLEGAGPAPLPGAQHQGTEGIEA